MPTHEVTDGEFCWMELATTNQLAAKAFYASLFGWTVSDQSLGPQGEYTIFLLDGREAAAGYTLPAEQAQMGVPPHWLVYIAVANADEAAARATELGGTVVAGPLNVMKQGRLAVIRDPSGAPFSVWQAIEHAGIEARNVPGAFCWADLSTPDQAGAAAFYSRLVGWELTGSPASYLHIKNGPKHIGGVQPAAHRNPGTPAHWLIYFQVADVDAVAAHAESLGARLYLRPTTMENVGRMAVIADPQGATFAIFKPADAPRA